MNESQAGPNNLLDTTDCLEAVGVFKGWKNLLFVIVFLCLLVLQASFVLVELGCIEIEAQAVAGEPIITFDVTEIDEEQTESVAEEIDAMVESTTETVVEAADTEEAEVTEEIDVPEQAVESEETDAPAETTEQGETSEPEGDTETEEAAEPVSQITRQKLQRAIAWPPTEFFSGLTFENLSWIIRITNAVLILTASLYCLSMLFSLKVSMLGRLGGINHISRAFFLSLLMLILILPWQRIFGGLVPGAIYTPEELVEWSSKEASDIFDTVVYYLRFSGYWLLVFLLLILSQIRSIRWGKAILRRLEII